MRDDLHSIHLRVKLFGDAIEQAEGTTDQQQIRGNATNTLAKLHSCYRFILLSLAQFTLQDFSRGVHRQRFPKLDEAWVLIIGQVLF
jgi:hypothetical protein